MAKNLHRGGDLRDFLADQGILGEVEARALKQALALQLERLLNEQALTKTQMATRMKTSPWLAINRWICSAFAAKKPVY